jgi:hypothetical protein
VEGSSRRAAASRDARAPLPNVGRGRQRSARIHLPVHRRAFPQPPRASRTSVPHNPSLYPLSQVGACEAVIAGDTQGNVHSSFPLADDGNYKFWVRTVP